MYLIDSGDPLKSVSAQGLWDVGVDLEGVWRADSFTLLTQLLELSPGSITESVLETRRVAIAQYHQPQAPAPTSFLQKILAELKVELGSTKEVILNEAISNYPNVWNFIRPERPGSFYTSGGSSLGWGLGASVGAVLALREQRAAASECIMHFSITNVIDTFPQILLKTNRW